MRILDHILASVRNVRPSGVRPDQWTGLCPAHQDKQASLSIAEAGDGTILLYCATGCSIEAVCAALGLKPADLFPDDSEPLSQRMPKAAVRDLLRRHLHILLQILDAESDCDDKKLMELHPELKIPNPWGFLDQELTSMRLIEAGIALRYGKYRGHRHG